MYDLRITKARFEGKNKLSQITQFLCFVLNYKVSFLQLELFSSVGYTYQTVQKWILLYKINQQNLENGDKGSVK